ncbi:hypothetical protein JRO89_XS02G0069400 [Xanthoceras sorbifolium]|uniref:Uncharacterized protein n=1 Tax=Xanthoceras sorbifolium TaxID=99658 RepID=A0ABQ8IG95_9ROSI|nr:hypothetical protein JRO89_XS02G0069400 [Xanthoceras sorbifolium]
MNHNILRSTPSSDPRAMEDGCRRELTRTYSDSSDITVESLYQSANAKLGQSAEWTNEKHSAYLNFLEASFVQQLHQLRSSMGLHGRCTQENISGPCSSQLLSANNRHSSDQDGRWQKIKFEVNETLFEDAADTHGMLESPRIHHFPSVGKLQTATSFDALEHNVLSDEGLHSRENTTFSFEPAGSSEQHLDRHLCHPSLDDCAMELREEYLTEKKDKRNDRPKLGFRNGVKEDIGGPIVTEGCRKILTTVGSALARTEEVDSSKVGAGEGQKQQRPETETSEQLRRPETRGKGVGCNDVCAREGNSSDVNCGMIGGRRKGKISVYGNKREVSDQNFVDENQRDKSSRGSTAKRLKTAGVDALSIDQVSLFRRCHSPNVTAVRRASSEREERIHHPESFATPRPRSNMHYFLRGN